MISIGDTLISTELFEKRFVCDLKACKGQCCIDGESGAPLDQDELEKLDEVYDEVKPFMRPEGIAAIEESGLYEIDADGDFVTPLVNGGECAYVVFDADGTAKCAIERAWLEGKTQWQKPISCHLYPIRINKLTEFEALNYHRWPICDPACKLGASLDVEVFRFLKQPLIRKYGSDWYAELEQAYILYQDYKKDKR
ncbi:MAG: DUF3109 family protein [Flavobacteriales bacterium]|nr:DUF3109 family protein [Flavobacteriales bacterium]